MLLVDVFDTEIIHNEAESDGAPVMFPKPWADFTLLIAFCIQTFFEELLGYFPGKGEAVHPLSDFEIEVSIFGDFVK